MIWIVIALLCIFLVSGTIFLWFFFKGLGFFASIIGKAAYGFIIFFCIFLCSLFILGGFWESNKKEIEAQEKIEELRDNSNIGFTKDYYLPGDPISLEFGEYAIVKTKANYSFDFYPINGYPSIRNLKWERTGWDSDLELYDIKVWNEGQKVDFKTIEYLK